MTDSSLGSNGSGQPEPRPPAVNGGTITDEPSGHGGGGSSGERGPVMDRLTRAYEGVRRRRGLVALAVYAAVGGASYLAAYLLRFDFNVPSGHWQVFVATVPVVVVVRVAAARLFRLSTSRWRFVGTEDVLRLGGATSAGTATIWAGMAAVPALPVAPRSILVMDLVLVTVGTAGLWLGYRIVYERIRCGGAQGGNHAKKAVVIGAGEAGNMLARQMARYPTGHRLVGFVDDDPAKQGSRLHGAPVFGSVDELEGVVETTGAEEIIIALPSASPEELRRIVERCEAVECPFKVLPGIADVFAGDVRTSQLRPLRVEDLLGREPVTLELPELQEDLSGRSVLITGGAGSIGAELARQVAANHPARLVLLDHAESDLYFIERELRDRHPSLELAAVVGDALDEEGLEQVFRAHRPHRVFHAAAYKHVPLMETNTKVAVRNNVLGTWRVARAAARQGAGKFVLISTDKAVDPSSVMGATKRVAEQVVMAVQEEHPETAFLAVRFGNVLGSNGSVVPVFRRQLEKGEPLTVTHPEVTRYFMTIAEAVQLVLQASLLEEAQGRIAMLDMGEPVRIVDLARNMIRLSGLREDVDAHIEFTGLRPGEKMHEELTGADEAASATAVDTVWLVEEGGERNDAVLWSALESMEERLPAMDGDELRALLWEQVRPGAVAPATANGPVDS